MNIGTIAIMKFPYLILLALTWGTTAQAASSTIVFFQSPATTKRSGTAPAEIPAIVGAPNTPTRNPEEEERLRQINQLENLLRQRLERQRGDTGKEEAPPEQPTPEPETRVTPPARSGSRSGSGMQLRLRNAPIDTLVDQIMSELGYSYVIDPSVSGTVNIFTHRSIPNDKLFGVLEQVLKMNNLAIVKQEDLYVIVPMDQSPRMRPPILPKPAGPETSETVPQEPSVTAEPAEPANPAGQAGEQQPPAQTSQQEEPPTPSQEGPTVLPVGQTAEAEQLEDEEGIVTYIIPLNYIPSDQMLTMAQTFVSSGATVVNFQPANMLIITDFRRNIQQVLNLVNLLDTQYFRTNTVDLIPVRFNQAEEVAEDLGKVFAPGDTAAGVRIVAIERLNSLLVVTRTPEAFAEVRKWIERLDAPSTTSNIKTFVYQVENNTAVQISQILAELFADGFGLPSSATMEAEAGEAQGPGAAAAREGERRATQEARFVPGSQLNQGFGPASRAEGNILGTLGPQLQAQGSEIRGIRAGNVKIVVNEFNNSLIIQGTESDIQFILDTVTQLDTLPRQVLIEAKIYSVELTDELQFGINAFLQARGAGLGGGNGDNGEGTGGLGPATTGRLLTGQDGTTDLQIISRAFIGTERELQTILTTLRAETNVEILESPRLLAMDGFPASINVGAEVPVTSASFGNPLLSGETNFINSIQFRSTGTTLLFIPRISASGIVTLELSIEVSSPSGPALTPTISRNFVQTNLLVRDGQTVALAGLISDQHNLSKNRIPLLGDIPILGALFGQTARTERRSELIVFITPHVVKSLPTAVELTLDFKRALKNAYEFVNEMERKEEELIEERRQKELEQKEKP